MPVIQTPCYWSFMLEVVCAILIRKDRVLVCQRPPGKHMAGSWEFPGGKIEKGETPTRALQREICEELQCHIAIHEPLASVRHDYPEVSINLHAFRCHLSPASPGPDPLEHTSIKWIECRDMDKIALADADSRIWRVIQSLVGRFCSPES